MEKILGVRFGRRYDPADHWQPWIGHWFPAVGPRDMAGLTFGQIVGMYEFAKGDSGG